MLLQTQNTDRQCIITSKKSRKALTISTDNETEGILIISQRTNAPQQRFKILKKDKYINIYCQFNKSILSVYNSSKRRGAGIISLPMFGVESQRFNVKVLNNQGECYIQSFCNMVLDCYQEGQKDGTHIIQWERTNKDHQKWIIQYI